MNTKAKRRGAQRKKTSAQRSSFSFKAALAQAQRWLSYLGLAGVVAALAIFVITWMPAVKDWWSVPMAEINFVGYTGGEFVGANSGGVSEEELLELALPLMGVSYWQLSVDQIKSAIETHPWVRRATVSKRWPAKLLVGIDEYVPVARWNDDKLMSMTGQLFRVVNVEAYANLPQFIVHWAENSDDQTVREMVQRFNRYQSILEPLSLEIKQIGLRTMDNVWLDTKNGLRIELGTQEHEARLERMIRFVIQQGIEQLDAWESIDLRYVSGISVREKLSYSQSAMEVSDLLATSYLNLLSSNRQA